MKPLAADGRDAPPALAGWVTTLQNSNTQEAGMPHSSPAFAASSIERRALSCSRHPRTVRVHQQIGADRDHRADPIQDAREVRSATSKPGGSPPGTTTHLIFRGARRERERTGSASSRRSPRSISTRRGVLVSAARFLARIRSSSGRSTVVFIREIIFLYSCPSRSAPSKGTTLHRPPTSRRTFLR